MHDSRIPPLTGTSKAAALNWLTALHEKGLLFHLDDMPQDLVRISDGSRTFTDGEAAEVTDIVGALFKKRGDELYELAFEVLSRTFHTCAERRQLKMMHG